ncbi:unnamed protein product [Ixodes hexagonus]
MAFEGRFAHRSDVERLSAACAFCAVRVCCIWRNPKLIVVVAEPSALELTFPGHYSMPSECTNHWVTTRTISDTWEQTANKASGVGTDRAFFSGLPINPA